MSKNSLPWNQHLASIVILLQSKWIIPIIPISNIKRRLLNANKHQHTNTRIPVQLVLGHQHSIPPTHKPQRNTVLQLLSNTKHQKCLQMIPDRKRRTHALVPLHVPFRPEEFDRHRLFGTDLNRNRLLDVGFRRIGTEMRRLLDVAQLGRHGQSTSSEETHHEPCVVILRLGIQGNYLRTRLQTMQRVVVTAADFSGHGIHPQKTTFGVLHQLLLLHLLRLFTGQTRAFVTARLTVLYPVGGLEQTGNFGHLRNGQEQILGSLLLEGQFALLLLPHEPLKEAEPARVLLTGEDGTLGLESQSDGTGLGKQTLLPEVHNVLHAGVRLNDDLALELRKTAADLGHVVRVLLVNVEDLVVEVLHQHVHHLVTVLVLRVVLNRQDNRVVVKVTITEFGNLANRLLEVNRLAERLVVEGMRNDRTFPVVVHIDFHALEPSLQILEIPIDLGVTGELVATEVGVMRGIAVVVGDGETLIEVVNSGHVVVLVVLEVGAEVVETEPLLRLPPDLRDELLRFPLHLLQEPQEILLLELLLQIVQLALQSLAGVLLKDRLEAVVAVGNPEIVRYLHVSQLSSQQFTRYLLLPRQNQTQHCPVLHLITHTDRR